MRIVEYVTPASDAPISTNPWHAICRSGSLSAQHRRGAPLLLAKGQRLIAREFRKAGHLPTLLAAFFYFDMSFMVWVMLGPLGVQIASSLGLNSGQKGLMVAVPVLAGALLRIVNGLLVDRLKPKAAGLIGQMIVIL